MADVFEGNPDARQLESDRLPSEVMLFRPKYRQLTTDELDLHNEIKAKAGELAALFAKIDPAPRESQPSPSVDLLRHIALNRGASVTLAIRHLEDAVYRAIKALTG